MPTETREEEWGMSSGQHPELEEEQVPNKSRGSGGKKRKEGQEEKSSSLVVQVSSRQWANRGARALCVEVGGTRKSPIGEQSLATVRDMQSHPPSCRRGVPMPPFSLLDITNYLVTFPIL